MILNKPFLIAACFCISASFLAVKFLLKKDLNSFFIKDKMPSKDEDKKESAIELENKKIGFGTSDR